MRKGSRTSARNDLRPKYDLSKLKGGVRGKYYVQARAGTNLVLIEPELAEVFPGEESVNRALRLLMSAARAATPAAGRPARSRRRPKSSPMKHTREAIVAGKAS